MLVAIPRSPLTADEGRLAPHGREGARLRGVGTGNEKAALSLFLLMNPLRAWRRSWVLTSLTFCSTKAIHDLSYGRPSPHYPRVRACQQRLDLLPSEDRNVAGDGVLERGKCGAIP